MNFYKGIHLQPLFRFETFQTSKTSAGLSPAKKKPKKQNGTIDRTTIIHRGQEEKGLCRG
jgi:hypothetical protein